MPRPPVLAAARSAARVVAASAVRSVPLSAMLSVRSRFDRTAHAHRRAAPPLLLRLARFRPIPPDVRMFSPPGRDDVHFVNVDSLATRWIFWMGMDYAGRHGAGPRLWEALCARADEIVEVGANIGFFATTGGAVARGTYRAYEPHPRSAKALRANLAANGLTAVDVVEAAVVPDAAGGVVSLSAPTGYDGATPLSAAVRPSTGDQVAIEVEALTISDVLGKCDLLKLDVEGLEADLLEASWSVLRKLAPVVMIEVHDVNERLRMLLPMFLGETDAQAFSMHRDSLRPVPQEAFAEGRLFDTFGTWDYLIVPRSRAGMIDRLVD